MAKQPAVSLETKPLRGNLRGFAGSQIRGHLAKATRCSLEHILLSHQPACCWVRNLLYKATLERPYDQQINITYHMI